MIVKSVSMGNCPLDSFLFRPLPVNLRILFQVSIPGSYVAAGGNYQGINQAGHGRSEEEGLNLPDSVRRGNEEIGSSYPSLVLLFDFSFCSVSVEN